MKKHPQKSAGENVPHQRWTSSHHTYFHTQKLHTNGSTVHMVVTGKEQGNENHGRKPKENRGKEFTAQHACEKNYMCTNTHTHTHTHTQTQTQTQIQIQTHTHTDTHTHTHTHTPTHTHRHTQTQTQIHTHRQTDT